jgi:hypothetical protein
MVTLDGFAVMATLDYPFDASARLQRAGSTVVRLW